MQFFWFWGHYLLPTFDVEVGPFRLALWMQVAMAACISVRGSSPTEEAVPDVEVAPQGDWGLSEG